MRPVRHISYEGLELLKRLEGWRKTAYQDVGGKWTIGYGHLIRKDQSHLVRGTITRDQGEDLLLADVRRFEIVVSDAVKVPLTQSQFDTLLIFVYNVGESAFRTSTLLARLNDGEYDSVPEELMRWIYVGKMVSPGLRHRREKEAELWKSDTQAS